MNVVSPVRRIDDLGRVNIPKEYRKFLDFNYGDNVKFFVTDDKRLIIEKVGEEDEKE